MMAMLCDGNKKGERFHLKLSYERLTLQVALQEVDRQFDYGQLQTCYSPPRQLFYPPTIKSAQAKSMSLLLSILMFKKISV